MALLISCWAPFQSAMSSPLAIASPPRDRISFTTSVAGPASTPDAVVRPAQVVDHHLGTLGGEQQRVLAPQASTGPGDDRDTPFECSHGSAR